MTEERKAKWGSLANTRAVLHGSLAQATKDVGGVSALAVAMVAGPDEAPMGGVVSVYSSGMNGGTTMLPPSWSWPSARLPDLGVVGGTCGDWTPLDAAGLPDVWRGTLSFRGVTAVSWVPVSDDEGMWGALLVCARRTQNRRPRARALEDAAEALRTFRRIEHHMLSRGNAFLVYDRWGKSVGISRAASGWLEAQPRERVQAFYDRWNLLGDGEHLELISSALVSFTPTPDTGGVVVGVRPAPPLAALIGHQLSPRLREAAEYASAGATAREIATAMGISHETVRGYLKDVYRVLGVSNRVELARSLGTLH